MYLSSMLRCFPHFPNSPYHSSLILIYPFSAPHVHFKLSAHHDDNDLLNPIQFTFKYLVLPSSHMSRLFQAAIPHTSTNTFHTRCSQALPSPGISAAEAGKEVLEVTFSDGSHSAFPYPWLRDNCQCHKCFDHDALCRKLTLNDWEHDDIPASVQVKHFLGYLQDGNSVVLSHTLTAP